MGKALMGLAMAAGICVYLLTLSALFAAGETGMAALALFVPPADLILAFLVSPTLGVLGVLSVCMFFVGAMVAGATNHD
jgi:membrane-bound ClpP family serine protease